MLGCRAAIEIGIKPTVRHGGDLGFFPIVVTDACAAGERAFDVLRLHGDTFMTTTDAFTSILSRKSADARG